MVLWVVLSTGCLSRGRGFLLLGHSTWSGWRWASGMGVVLLSCVSPLGAELEESNKNPKKLDAMTLIKEGGSRHT